MSSPGPSGRAVAAVVDGVDVDAVAGAARSRAAVAGLHGGSPGEIATYLPGRRVVGVRVAPDAVLVAVCARWGVPAVEVAAQIRTAVGPLAPGRRVDVMLADVTDPPARPGTTCSGTTGESWM